MASQFLDIEAGVDGDGEGESSDDDELFGDLQGPFQWCLYE